MDAARSQSARMAATVGGASQPAGALTAAGVGSRVAGFAGLVATLVILALPGCGGDPASGDGANTAADAAADSAADGAVDDGLSGDGADTPDPESLRVLNYNVMCSFCKNSAHPDWVQDWKSRVPWLLDVMTRHDADIIGTQELQAIGIATGAPDEFGQILPPGYETFYYRHKPGDLLDLDYPDAAIAWRSARFAKVSDGSFWLSPTPETAFSTGFDKGGQLPRLVVWVRLHDKLGKRDVTIVNTHFDNNSPSQDLSAPLLLERLLPLAKETPLVVMGDFNAAPASTAYAKLVGGSPALSAAQPALVDSFNVAKAGKGPVSNVEPVPTWVEAERIDHVFVHGSFTIDRWVVDLWRYGDKIQAPSDHPGAIVVDMHWPL